MKARITMTLRHTIHRLATAALLAPAPPPSPPHILPGPRSRSPTAANLAARLAEYALQGIDYSMQGLQYAEQVQSAARLAQQITQLDDTFNHMRDAANGRIGQLTSAFQQLSTANARTLLDADFGAWRNQLSGSSDDLAGALASMNGSSLSDFMVSELAAAVDVSEPQLRALFPNNPTASAALAADWVDTRERADRIRAADLATAEAAGRVTALLQAAQVDIDGRRGQGQLSHTALQQAQLANQLTAAEMDVALAQLHAIQIQQAALARHEAELLYRARMTEWLARQQAEQNRAAAYTNQAEQRRAAWRTVRGVVIR